MSLSSSLPSSPSTSPSIPLAPSSPAATINVDGSLAHIANIKKHAHKWRVQMNETIKNQYIVHANENPDDAILRCILGERCLHLDDTDNALKHLGHAAKLGVKTKKLYNSLGQTHLNIAIGSPANCTKITNIHRYHYSMALRSL